MSVNQRYADAASDIITHQGDVAAAAQRESGQIWGGAVSDIGKTFSQTLQGFVGAKHDEHIAGIFKQYGTDFDGAVNAVMAYDPERGAKLSSQLLEQKKFAFQVKQLQWETQQKSLDLVRNQLASVTDQTTLTAALVGAHLAGLDTSGISPTYDKANIEGYNKSLMTAYQRAELNKPKPPEPYTLNPGDLRFDANNQQVAAGGVKEPELGSPASVVAARVHENQFPGGQPAAAPVQTAAPTPAPPQAWQPPTTPIAPRGAGPSAGGPSLGAPPEWEKRADGSDKGNGFLGLQKRTDGSGKVSSEISIGTEDVEPGKEVEIPTMVPTLTPQETQWLLSHDISKVNEFPKTIMDKAVDFARSRKAAGLPYFATPAESPTTASPATAPMPAPTAPKMSRNQALILADEQEKAAAAKATNDAKAKEIAKPGTQEAFFDQFAKERGKTASQLSIKEQTAARKGWGQADDRAKVEVHLNSEGGIGTLDKEGLEFAAVNYRITGRLPARDKDQNGAIISLAAHLGKEQGLSPAVTLQKQAAFKADGGSLALMTKMSDASQASEAKALGQADLIRELSAKVSRSQYPLINSAIQAGKVDLLGDSNAKQLANALITFTSEYGKIIEGSTGSVAGSSDSARKASDKLIGAELSKGTMSDVLNLMGREMRLTNLGYDAAIGHITERMGGVAAPPGQGLTITPPPAPAGRQRVKGPNGQTGTMPTGAPLPTGWTVVQ